MKTKLISLLTILMLTLFGTCLAADWQWTKSNADVGFFFDKETLRYGMTNGQIDKDKIYVWLRAVLDDAYAQKKNRYAKSCSILFRNEQQKPPFELIPDTLMDDTMHAVKQYAHNHDKEITERTQKHSN